MFSKKNNVLVLFFVIILIINNSFFFTIPSFYYAILITYWLINVPIEMLTFRANISLFIVFYLACAFSIVVNDIPDSVQPGYRLMIFVVMTSLLGPFVSSIKLDKFRNDVFDYVNLINVGICSLSFILLITGIHQGQKMDDRYGTLRPDFAGLYGHSMILGPMSAIAVLYCNWKYKVAKNTKYKVFIALLMILCVLSCLKAGSRTSILGLLVSLPYLYYKFNGERLSKLFLFLCVTSFILLLTFPLYESNLSFLMDKFDYSSKQGSLTASRDSKWIARVDEFFDSPLFGVGYANVTHESVDSKGNIEPGSSWLSILSMTGILGFGIFLWFYVKIFIVKLRRTGMDNKFYLLLATVLFLSIYMIFEGVLMVAGTMLSALIWLSLGILNSKRAV
ncbi:O-antigen ligase family protein [Sphingobacterium multivorum]|uniref:O-antigen ligase family protein n=1 Tax=Sphingobacterium multivorum TaxID=28454 RepID=UPI00345E5CF5